MSALQFGNITCVPSFHNRLQFAIEVRRAFQEHLPDVVAIELPDIYYSDLVQALERLPRLSLLCIGQEAGRFSYIPIFPSDAMIEGARLARENRLPLALVDLAVPDYQIQIPPFAVPDDETIAHTGLEAFYARVAPHLPPTEPDSPEDLREDHMAARLLHLSETYSRVLFIGGMQHWTGVRQRLEAGIKRYHAHALDEAEIPFLAKLGPKARHELLEEMPYLVFHYELARRFGLSFDRLHLLRKLLIDARNAPVLKEEEYSPRELQNIYRYALKLAAVDKRVAPDLYNLLLAAKQCLGDDYALEVMDRALAYPYEDTEDLPEIDYDPMERAFRLGLNYITLQRRLPPAVDTGTGHHWIDLNITRKKKEEIPKGYAPLWFFFGFFSHIPEDLILEGFIERLGDKLASEQFENETRIHEFQGSLLDGIAMRETIRAHASGQLYVKEYRSRRVQIGAWVMIFDEDLRAEEYPWMMSLSAEHHNESDIAFYASNPAMHPVSKDIIRARYGAMLAIKPALPENEKISWEDLDVDEDLRKDQMLRLALRLSPRPGILYFSAEPPEAYFYELARALGKELFHLPHSRVSKRQLRRIQRFHLLSRREVRDIADDYI
jgi:hypothetical protein